MKKINLILLAFIGSAILVLAGEKVGYLNLDTAFSNYYKTLRENYNLELRRQSFEEQIEILKKEFQSSVDEFNKLNEDAENELLAEDARKDAARRASLLGERLQQKQTEYQKTIQEGMQQLDSLRSETEEKIIKDLTTLASRYAEEHDYTMIYEVSGKSLNRTPFLLVYPKDKEMSDDFVKFINAGHETEATEAKADLDKLVNKK